MDFALVPRFSVIEPLTSETKKKIMHPFLLGVPFFDEHVQLRNELAVPSLPQRVVGTIYRTSAFRYMRGFFLLLDIVIVFTHGKAFVSTWLYCVPLGIL